jgi:hypothetical protein
MRTLSGLLYALGGAAAGLAVGLVAGMAIVKLLHLGDRAAQRTIEVRLHGRQVAYFAPPMPRTPTPGTDWSAWLRPGSVEPDGDAPNTASSESLVELRWRVGRYGD